jgi:hypothetical protein
LSIAVPAKTVDAKPSLVDTAWKCSAEEGLGGEDLDEPTRCTRVAKDAAGRRHGDDASKWWRPGSRGEGFPFGERSGNWRPLVRGLSLHRRAVRAGAGEDPGVLFLFCREDGGARRTFQHI